MCPGLIITIEVDWDMVFYTIYKVNKRKNISEDLQRVMFKGEGSKERGIWHGRMTTNLESICQILVFTIGRACNSCAHCFFGQYLLSTCCVAGTVLYPRHPPT